MKTVNEWACKLYSDGKISTFQSRDEAIKHAEENGSTRYYVLTFREYDGNAVEIVVNGECTDVLLCCREGDNNRWTWREIAFKMADSEEFESPNKALKNFMTWFLIKDEE